MITLNRTAHPHRFNIPAQLAQLLRGSLAWRFFTLLTTVGLAASAATRAIEGYIPATAGVAILVAAAVISAKANRVSA